MNKYGLAFHHLGLAVRRPERAIPWLEGLGYQIGQTVRDELQKVNLIMCSSPSMPAVEIVFESGTAGPLAGILKANATMIYHVCYETESLDHSLSAIKNDSIVVLAISPPKPAILFQGRKVSFYQIQGFGMIEIME